MITKAGVPTNQLALGVTSYGRSFQMVDRTCTGKTDPTSKSYSKGSGLCRW